LARNLGVTPTAIRKYLRRDTHPSNEVIRRALAIMESYEEEKIFMIIIQDFLSALKMLYDSLDEPYKERMRKIIEETILQ
jgi:transcriptional regulator with XRE-family HTH domain